MTKNYMAEVAKMLDVELGEWFCIDKVLHNPCKFTKKGLVDKRGDIQPSVLWYVLTGCYEIKKEILNDKEKEYLEAVLKPFRERSVFISKYTYDTEEFINIRVDNEETELPNFKKGTMYKGMQPKDEYSLDELGLFK